LLYKIPESGEQEEESGELIIDLMKLKTLRTRKEAEKVLAPSPPSTVEVVKGLQLAAEPPL